MAASLSSLAAAQTEISNVNISFTLTVTAGQTVVLIFTSRDAAGATYVSSTWNGSNQPADEVTNGTFADGIQSHVLVYRGITGTGVALVVTMNSAQDGITGWPVIVDGANQTQTIPVSGGFVQQTDNSGGSSTTSLSALTTTTDDLVIYWMRQRGDVTGSAAVIAGQTLRDGPTLTAIASSTIIISSKPGGAGTTNGGYTFASGNIWMANGLVIAGVSGGGPTYVLMGAACL